MSVLRPEQHAAVVACLQEGKGIRETATEVGVARGTVVRIDRDELHTPPRSTAYRSKGKKTPNVAALASELHSLDDRRNAVRKVLLAERDALAKRIQEIDNLLREERKP